MAGVCVVNLQLASLLFVFAALSTAEVCPFPCVCYPNLDEDRSTLTVDCRGQELEQVPYLIPNSTSHLDLSGNEIEFIRMGDFPVLPRLTYLQLQNNAITRILPGALQGLTNLQRLTLYNNRIMELRTGVFLGLSRLQHLDAYNIQLQRYDIDVFNSLEDIVEIDLSFNNLQSVATGSFSGLRRLQRLTLSYNIITNIEPMAITNLSSLNHLAIDNNQLSSVTPRAFTRLPSIRTVALQGNPLECGCDALWLYNWLNRKRLAGPTCAQPENLAGRGLLSLQLMEFCALPVASIPGPDDIITTSGMTLRLQCLATGAPPPEITWSREGMTFDLDDERVAVMGGSLVITEVNENDSGVYYCTAISTAGRVAASTRVTVLNETAENFTSILARLRQNMELECSESLPPGVPVAWEFNSTRLLLSDKYVITVNGSLLVRNVQLEDMGEYQCVVDGVRLTRELVIEASPEIVQFPEGPCDNPSELTVNSNQVTELTCAVFGIPPPSVRWFYNGDLQVTQLPAPGVDGGTTTAVLELFRPAPEVGGTYTCVADNELGNTTRTVLIAVRLILQPGSAPIIQFNRVAGDTVVMECDTTGIMDQISLVRWERMDGLPLPLSRINFTSSNTTLVLKEVQVPDDIAIYTCRVQSEGGMVLILNYALALVEPPSIEKQCDIPVVIRLVGDDIILNCSATGNPPVDITWTKDGEDVLQALPGRVQLMNGGMRLLILSAEDEDSGNYTCLGVNLVDNDTYTITLDVQRRPYFLHRPVDRQVSVTDIAQLRCQGAGNPQPTVTWWRVFSGSMAVQQVRPTNWIIISDQYLVFLETRASDEGEYYCNISSPIQTRTTADDPTFLRVYIPPSLPPLQVEYRVLEGEDNVTLECRGTGDPVPNVHWLRNSDILPVAGQFQLADGSLVIEGVEAADAGEYTCRVANVAGMVYHTVNLIVRTLPDTRVEPRSLRANVGCQATLFCSDGGETPVEEVTWMFNGNDLASGGRLVIRSSGELVISDLEVADTGNYTCAIWGLAGAGESTALLIVEDPLFGSGVDTSPPTISSPTPSSQDIPNGQTAMFVCVAAGFPQPTIQWLRNGQPQPNFQRVTINGGSLTIEQLRITDTAVYECVASSVLGQDRMAFSLTVTQLPSFLTPPVPLTLMEVQTLRLSCTAEGDPDPEIMWLINDTAVTSGRVIVGNGSLVIHNTSVSDSGAYSCVARNNAGVVQYTVPVVVHPQQAPPNITVPPRSSTTMAGNSIALDCIAGGIPHPQITWLKGGELLVTTCTSVGQVDCARVDGPSVFIQSVQEQDTGRYTCIAESTAGRAVYEVFVTVVTAQILPFFTIYPMPVWVTNGTTISVDCQAGGSPPPNITWLIGFEPVNVSEGVVVLDNGTLVIEDAGFEDSGLYTCRASNSAGANQIVITIDVVREEDVITDPPVVGISLAPIDLAPGDTVVLDCVANGSPIPDVVWLREGDELNYTEYNNIYLADNGSLVLANVTELEEGNYTCQAVNNGGTAAVHVRIEVLEGQASGQGAPRFTVMPHDQQVLSGTPVRVDCQAKGSPTPYIMWTQSDRPVYESDLVSVAANGSLMILSARMVHSGKYNCRAANSKGVAETGIELKIMPREEPPYFVAQPADVRVVVSDHFILRCEAASHEGHTHTRWLVDGQEVGGAVQEVGGARREVLGDGSLLVVKTELSDSGEYTCSASNQHGEMNATATVRILRHPLNVTRSTVTGSSAQLECGVGEKQVWSKDGHSLPVSSRLLVYGTSLWVFRVQEGDEGEYTCTAGGYLNNYYLEVLVSPKIVDSSTLVVVRKGHTAALHCTAEGRPHPQLSWLRAGQQLEQHSHYSFLHNGTLLVYSSDAGRDSGEYVCQAVNTAGTAQSTALVIVTA